MYLNKLLLKEFGKFHNKEIELKPGLNLIYGDNESGKTTIKEFIIGMLYGIEKSRGLGAKLDNYELRKPLDGRGFSGMAYIRKDGKSYLIERSFLRTSKKTSVLDVQSGRETKLNVPNSLQGTMIDTDKSTYANTLCIGEHGAAPGKELADELSNYLVNFTTSGTADIDKDKAVEYLKQERKKNDTKPLVRRLDELTEKIEAYESVDKELEELGAAIAKTDEEFAIEAAKRKRVARRLVENEDGTVSYKADEELDKKINKLAEMGQDISDEDSDEKKVKFTDRLPVIFGTGLLVVLAITLIVYLLPFEPTIKKLFIIFTVIFVIFTIIDGLRVKGFFENDDISTPSEEDFKKILAEIEEEKEEKEAVEFDMTFAREYADKKSELKARETKLINDRSEMNRLKAEFNAVFKKKSDMEVEIRSINLAIKTIEKQSTKIHDDFGFLINDHVSEMVSKITDGKYNEVKLDETLHIMVKDGDSFVGIEYLSAGTVEQIYLAVRLSVARLLLKDNVPLIIDDIFTSYDETRLVNTLDCLKTIKTDQIILMTSNKHIGDMLDDLDMDYNYVEL